MAAWKSWWFHRPVGSGGADAPDSLIVWQGVSGRCPDHHRGAAVRRRRRVSQEVLGSKRLRDAKSDITRSLRLESRLASRFASTGAHAGTPTRRRRRRRVLDQLDGSSA